MGVLYTILKFDLDTHIDALLLMVLVMVLCCDLLLFRLSRSELCSIVSPALLRPVRPLLPCPAHLAAAYLPTLPALPFPP